MFAHDIRNEIIGHIPSRDCLKFQYQGQGKPCAAKSLLFDPTYLALGLACAVSLIQSHLLLLLPGPVLFSFLAPPAPPALSHPLPSPSSPLSDGKSAFHSAVEDDDVCGGLGFQFHSSAFSSNKFSTCVREIYVRPPAGPRSSPLSLSLSLPFLPTFLSLGRSLP